MGGPAAPRPAAPVLALKAGQGRGDGGASGRRNRSYSVVPTEAFDAVGLSGIGCGRKTTTQKLTQEQHNKTRIPQYLYAYLWRGNRPVTQSSASARGSVAHVSGPACCTASCRLAFNTPRRVVFRIGLCSECESAPADNMARIRAWEIREFLTGPCCSGLDGCSVICSSLAKVYVHINIQGTLLSVSLN